MQKRVICIHSLAGAGRCGLTIALPVLSSMGHEVSCLPTVVLSTHTGGFSSPAREDLGALCKSSAEHYVREGIGFDCVYAGYMPSLRHVSACLALYESSVKPMFLLDPVMGDGGKMYASLPDNLPQAMRNAAKYSTVITPNETEVSLLLSHSFEPIQTEASATKCLEALAKFCGGDIVITGLTLANGSNVNACRDRDGTIALLEYHSTCTPLHGTGDLFASVLCGSIMQNNGFFQSVKRAASFVSQCALNATKTPLPERFGIPFEPLLPALFPDKGDFHIDV